MGAAAAFAIIACGAAIVIALLYRDNAALLIGAVTVAAISLEVLFWTAAGVFGWSFLAKRRAALGRLRERIFGARRSTERGDAEP